MGIDLRPGVSGTPETQYKLDSRIECRNCRSSGVEMVGDSNTPKQPLTAIMRHGSLRQPGDVRAHSSELLLGKEMQSYPPVGVAPSSTARGRGADGRHPVSTQQAWTAVAFYCLSGPPVLHTLRRRRLPGRNAWGHAWAPWLTLRANGGCAASRTPTARAWRSALAAGSGPTLS